MKRYLVIDEGEDISPNTQALIEAVQSGKATILRELDGDIEGLLEAAETIPGVFTALWEVAEERFKQLEKGWTAKHDKEYHSAGELVRFAIYLLETPPVCSYNPDLPDWIVKLKGKSDTRARQIIAAAFLLAELQRTGDK